MAEIPTDRIELAEKPDRLEWAHYSIYPFPIITDSPIQQDTEFFERLDVRFCDLFGSQSGYITRLGR